MKCQVAAQWNIPSSAGTGAAPRAAAGATYAGAGTRDDRGRTITGAGAAWWCIRNNVDKGAKKVFLSLTLHQQDEIRKMGTVRNTSNPSKVLMGRIRKVAGQDFIPEAGRSPVQALIAGPRQQIVVCIRGEAFRIGGRGAHNTGLPEEEWQAILRSIADNIVLPLHSKGYQVLLFGDVVADEHRLHEVEEAFRQCLPPRHDHGDPCEEVAQWTKPNQFSH